MKKYADRRRRAVSYKKGEWVLLSTKNLKVKGTPQKFQRRFIGPFKIEETIGSNAYRLALPSVWKMHPTFHVSLLKRWNESQ